MGHSKRIALYREIERIRGRPLLVYVTSKRARVEVDMATDMLPYLIDLVDALPAKKSSSLDFLIVSFGGDPMVALRIMTLLRERGKKDVTVIVPQSAYSAATLLALGADRILIHPNGHLGPIDMQVVLPSNSDDDAKDFSTEDLTAFLDFVRDGAGLRSNGHLQRPFELLCEEVQPLAVGYTVRAANLARHLAEKLLEGPYPGNKKRSLRARIASQLSRDLHSHEYPIHRAAAKAIGLRIAKADKQLEGLVWDVWLDIEDELQERRRFSLSTEFLRHAGRRRQLFKWIRSAKRGKQAQVFGPVDFALLHAILESSNLGFHNVSRRSIMALGSADGTLRYEAVTLEEGWRKVYSGK